MKRTHAGLRIRFMSYLLSIAALTLVHCSASKGGTTSGNPEAPEDSSSSGVVAEAVGGALTSSNPNAGASTLKTSGLERLMAGHSGNQSTANSCPTYRSPLNDGCTESGSTLWLTYNQCSFGSTSSDWAGTQAMIKSSGTASCGTFPNPGANGTLDLQYVTAAGSTTPGSTSVTSSFGSTVVIDDASPNLGNFDNTPITTLVNGGYGSSVTFNASGARSSLVIDHRIYQVAAFDHSLTGSLNVSESPGGTSRTLSGSISVYHNALRVIGTSTFTNVVHEDTCCLPVSGYITTAFHAGTKSPTTLGELYVGQSETLTFTGCGTATLQAYDGSTQAVTLSRCF